MSVDDPVRRPELEAAVEAILFVTPEPISVARILAAFDESEQESARAALEAVRARYAADDSRGVRLEEVAGGLRIVTAPECHPYLRRFFDAGGGSRLSMAALETLAIVAYRQPVTGPEIQELRGKSPVAALKTLLDRRLIRIAGRKEVVGRPFLYATTREFLMHFGLRSLDELPPLEEFEETFGSAGDPVPETAAEHAAIGLLSIEEAEAMLGSSRFGVHEHAERSLTADAEEPPADEAAGDERGGVRAPEEP